LKKKEKGPTPISLQKGKRIYEETIASMASRANPTISAQKKKPLTPKKREAD